MNPKCHICGTPSDFLMRKDGFDEYICGKCGLSFVYPQPDKEWLRDNVYSYESGYQANKNADLSETPIDKVSRKILAFLGREKPKGRILDVGCSSGQFLYWARERGFETAGVEINKRTADIARSNGLDVYNGFLEDATFAKKSFDILFIGDVIEHVNDPRSFLKKAQEFLKDDGIIVISTPNTDCFWCRETLFLYRWFGIPWAPATPPHHLWQFGFGNQNMLMRELGMEHVYAFFSPPPSLRYELGSLHLYKDWKAKKSIGSLLFMLFSFSVYAVAFALNLVLSPVLSRDFRMIVFYANNR
ncbi:class I SAM-dependent methyltransferase [Candidatus Parcubacteria bacterium]|nr:class I SAM-dependent methyltransferase [Candidatus Parcubacteria bacterium]